MPGVRSWTGEQIAALRHYFGLTQAELGSGLRTLSLELGQPAVVHTTTVSRWERDTREPTKFYTRLLTAYFEQIAARKGESDLDSLIRDAIAKYRELLAVVSDGVAIKPDNPPDFVRMLSAQLIPDTSVAALLVDHMKRRTFARYLLMAGAMGLVRADALGAAFDRSSAIDDALADSLQGRALQYMQQWDRLPPQVLLTAVMGHLDEIQAAANASQAPQIARRLRVIASETAAFAGMLGWFTQDRGIAEVGLTIADDCAEAEGHSTIQAIVLTIRADFYSHVQVGRQVGSAIARSMLEAATLAVGKAPSPVRAWILMRLAEEYAVIGRERQTYHLLDSADKAFASLGSVSPGMFGHWNLDMHHAFRGNCTQLLGRYNDSIDILVPVLDRIPADSVSNRIALQTDMAAVHARQGDPVRATSLLASSLATASQAGLRERIKRIHGIRSTVLAPFESHSAVKQLDDQLLSMKHQLP